MTRIRNVLVTIYKTNSITEQPETVRLSEKTNDFILGYLKALEDKKIGKIYISEIK